MLIKNEINNSLTIFSSAEGHYLIGKDGKKYIDTSLGNGVHIFGHSNKELNEIINKAVSKGIHFATKSESLEKLEVVLQGLFEPTFDSIVLCSSGSEATMRAVRLARAVTGKSKVVVVCGSWHGGTDSLMYDCIPSSKDEFSFVSKGSGIISSNLSQLIPIKFCDSEDAIDKINGNKKDIAAIIIEPIQGGLPHDKCKNYLKLLRKLANAVEAPLIFDEIILGLRLRKLGAIDYFGITPDIATFGKSFGAGLPVGAVVWNEKITEKLSTQVFFGGTFSGNPLVCETMAAVINKIDDDKMLYQKFDSVGQNFRDSLNAFFISNDYPMQVYGVSSIFRIVFTKENIHSRTEREYYELDTHDRQSEFYAELLKMGVYFNSNRLGFFSRIDIEDTSKLLIERIKFATKKIF
jgi:glutamate-1-semialdehyde 2,1-aminomutase